ncbi:hypothetical protein HPB49_022585 [Dermacentor silvarum]|uniref:Uncharacterized protein n=1 Tax=Dermacentor silvarum TaxID=543639 RepID=A0ACB8D0E8_DERSI|nr:hypothetical protein HPB49_022585 [Dermacentor silvarum]
MSSQAIPGTTASSTTKRKVLSLKVKRAILDEVWQKIKKNDIARKYGIAQSTLATIIKNASKIDAVLDDDVGSGERKQIRAATYGDVEAALYKWFVDARAKNVPLNGPILLAQAKRLGFALGHENFNPGKGWLQQLDRDEITCKSIVGEAASFDEDGLQRWMVKQRSRILETYTERDIYNETGLFFQLLPAKTLAAKIDDRQCCRPEGATIKVVFFASGARRDMKSETILHCFEKAGFSRGRSAAEEITAEADIDAAAADGAAALTSLGQLWEAAGNASLVPSGLDYLDFALADQDLVATEELHHR